MRKAVRALALLLLAALVLAGCASNQQSSSHGRVTLTVLTHYDSAPFKPGLEKLVAEWNRTHPEIQVRLEDTDYGDLLQTIMVRQAAGQAPDIIQPYALWTGQLAQANVLLPAPSSVADNVRAGYSKAAVGAVSLNGTVYGYPTEVETYNLFYNKKEFAEAGITHPPTTWQQLETDARETTKRDSHGNLTVEGFGVQRGQDSYVVHPFLSMLQAAGGSFLDQRGSGAAFDSPAGRAALGVVTSLIHDHATDPGIDVTQAFPSGLAAMTVNAGWWLSSLRLEMGKQYHDVGVAPIPGPTPGSRGSLAYAFFLGVDSQSEHAKQAWEFLTWLNAGKDKNSAVTRMDAFEYAMGSIPGRPADARALVTRSSDPNTRPFLAALGYAMPEPNIAHGQQIKSILENNIEATWIGQQSVPGALGAAVAQTDHLLGP